MKKKITINLKTPLRSPSGEVTTVVLREPNVFEVLAHGDPFLIGSSPSGATVAVESPEVITAYVKLCLVEPADPNILHQGGVELARQIKDAVMGFFLGGHEGAEASETSPTISPSADTAAA